MLGDLALYPIPFLRTLTSSKTCFTLVPIPTADSFPLRSTTLVIGTKTAP